MYLIPEAFLSGSKQVRTPADAGYEPNALSSLGFAMAERRGVSMPATPLEGGAGAVAMNPFWSERAQMEGRLRSLRPGDLPPVPAGDSDEMEEMPALSAGGSRGRLRSRSGADRGKGTGEAAQKSEEAERIGSRERFHVVAAYTLPVKDEIPLVESLRQVGCDGKDLSADPDAFGQALEAMVEDEQKREAWKQEVDDLFEKELFRDGPRCCGPLR